MNSHEYAKKLKELAEFLLSKPEFQTPYSQTTAYTAFYYWGDKAGFLGAVKALGSVRKEWRSDDLNIHSNETDMLRLQIARTSICRKVRDAEYECEPLLSQAEEAEIGAQP